MCEHDKDSHANFSRVFVFLESCVPLVIISNTSLSDKEFPEDVKSALEVLITLTLEACSNKSSDPTTTVQSNLTTN